MAGAGPERGRGPEHGRGRARGRSHDPGRGSAYYQVKPRRSSSQESGSSSSSSSYEQREQRREQRRLEAAHEPPPRDYGTIPIRIVKERKPKPQQSPPKKPEDYADAVGYQNPSPPSGKSSPPSSLSSPVSSIPSQGEYPKNFPTIQESLRGRKSAPAEDVSSVPTKQITLKEMFKNLLNNYGRSADGAVSYYQALGELNSKLKRETIKIKFDHLLNEEYITLALKINEKSAQDKEHLWLQPVASEFLNTWFKYDTKDKCRLRFQFIKEPKSIFPLSYFTTEVVVEKQPVYDGKYRIVRTTKMGRLVYLSVLNHVLTVNKGGQSWKGKFEEQHIYILAYHGKGRLRCVILAKRSKIYEDDSSDRILDLQGVDIVLSPRYKLDSEFPAFFTALQADLKGLTPNRLKDTGILSVLPCHYSLNTPTAWGFLVWKVHLVVQQLKASGTDFSSVFGQKASVDDPDWRPMMKNSEDDVIKGVYGHDNNLDNDKFTNDLQGMSDCDRHLIQHAHHHPKSNPVRIRQNDESELFAAFSMPSVVPDIVCGLFKTPVMKFKKELGQVYEDFCKLCYDPDEDVDADLDEDAAED